MPSLKDLKYRDSQVVTDRSGHEVDLGNLDRNFSEMVTPEGDRVTNPKLQPYMDNPQLADTEASIEFLKAREDKENMGYDNRVTKLDTKAALKNKTEDATRTIEGYNKGIPPKPAGDFVIPGEGERERLEKWLIDTKFGGQDPQLFDPTTAVLNLPEEHFARLYAKMYRPGEPADWGLLDEKQKAAFVKNMRSVEFERIKRENQVKLNIRNEALGHYDAERKKRELAYKEAQSRMEKSVKEQRDLKEKVEKQRASEKDEYLNLRKDLIEQQSRLVELNSGRDKEGYARTPDPEQVKQQQEILKTLQDRVAELRDKLYEKTPDPSKGMPMTEELVRKYVQEAKGNRELARMNAIRDGYNPSKPDHTHRADKQH
jgi:hypothetical protein